MKLFPENQRAVKSFYFIGHCEKKVTQKCVGWGVYGLGQSCKSKDSDSLEEYSPLVSLAFNSSMAVW